MFQNSEDDDGLGTTLEIAAAFRKIHDNYLKHHAAQHEIELAATRERLYSNPKGHVSAATPQVFSKT